VGHSLEKWAARAVRVKTKILVKNETRKDEGAGVREEGDGNEHEVGEREDGEDFEVSSLRCASEDQYSEGKQHKGDDEFAGDDAPGLCVERFPKRAEHGQRRETEHGQTECGNEWDLIAERHSPQSDEEDQDSERDSIGVKGKQVWWPKQENGHRGHIKDGRKSQSQMKRAKEQTSNAPKGAVLTVPG